MATLREYIAVGALAATLSGIHFVKKYLRRRNLKDDDTIYEVLFFCNEGVRCRSHFDQLIDIKSCPFTNCPFYNMNRMLYYLDNTEHSLDVCLYLITVKHLAAAIVRAKNRGVHVRVYTDEDMENGSGSQIPYFREKGLQVERQKKTTTLMHHKFVIIDRRIVMTGSLNWTMQAICGNWDNLIITSEPEIVRPFSQEFDRLWES